MTTRAMREVSVTSSTSRPPLVAVSCRAYFIVPRRVSISATALDPRGVSNEIPERLVDIPVSGKFTAADDAPWGAGLESDAEREDLERCLVAAESMPPLFPLKDYRRQLFPWLERSVMPSSLQDWLKVASNSDVAEASRALGVRYLFLWNTHDSTEPAKGAILCGGGYGGAGCLGLMWMERKTIYRGLLIDIYSARVVDFPEAEVAGHTSFPRSFYRSRWSLRLRRWLATRWRWCSRVRFVQTLPLDDVGQTRTAPALIPRSAASSKRTRCGVTELDSGDIVCRPRCDDLRPEWVAADGGLWPRSTANDRNGAQCVMSAVGRLPPFAASLSLSGEASPAVG